MGNNQANFLKNRVVGHSFPSGRVGLWEFHLGFWWPGTNLETFAICVNSFANFLHLKRPYNLNMAIGDVQQSVEVGFSTKPPPNRL